MAEPEELLTGAARLLYVRWRQRFRPRRAPAPRAEMHIASIAPRLEILLHAVTGRAWPLRAAAPPLPPTVLARLFDRTVATRPRLALPATDGRTIWLPPSLPAEADALRLYRAMALQQAIKALRGSARIVHACSSPAERFIALLLETLAVDAWLAARLPGIAADVGALRTHALAQRESSAPRSAGSRLLEDWRRAALACPPQSLPAWLSTMASTRDTTNMARTLAATLPADSDIAPDCWTGRLEAPLPPDDDTMAPAPATTPDTPAPRSARLRRPPRVRPTRPDEEDDEPGHFSLQADSPLDHVEDPQGLQRPADRDADADAGDLADAVADLEGARLVRTPGRAHEVLLSELDLPARAKQAGVADARTQAIHYPEWDHRAGAYRLPGARVHAALGAHGDEAWVTRTLETQRATLALLRRRFEQLRARRVTLRRQRDGNELDLDACIADRADARVGLPRCPAPYLQERPARRDLAVLVLTDVSGSTDAWLADDRRVIDVEREALLLVCAALDALGEAYAVMAFSGESAQGVEVRDLKRFEETNSRDAWRRIAALEPDRYTRVGAALRHATATLMQQRRTHRLLILLSDGKPNDVDDYDGPYGVHDLRQAVLEAKARGLHLFCITVDRSPSDWLPAVFGRGGYGLLQQPERLPLVLVECLRRLIAG